MRQAIRSLSAVLLMAALAGSATGAAEEGLRIEGYLQARAVVTERPTAVYPFEGGTFAVRRARIKFTHSVGVATAVVQLDGAASGRLTSDGTTPPIIRDAYVQVPFGIGSEGRPYLFWAGQYQVPFGYTMMESSRVRLFPERPVGFEADSAGGLALFPSGYERGFRLTYRPSSFTSDLAVVNGGGINLPLTDPDNSKDVYLRAEQRFGSVGVAASGRIGSQSFTGTVRQRSLWGVGVDVRQFLAGQLTAEYVTGRHASSATNRTTPQAWYVQYLYRLGPEWLAGARYASWDPDTDNSGVPDGAGEERGPGLAVAYEPDAHLRFTGSVEQPLVMTDAGRKNSTVGILQLQYSF